MFRILLVLAVAVCVSTGASARRPVQADGFADLGRIDGDATIVEAPLYFAAGVVTPEFARDRRIGIDAPIASENPIDPLP